MRTQAEIKAEYEELKDELREHDAARLLIVAKMKALRFICKHPNGKTYYCMGESDFGCPDCGLG